MTIEIFIILIYLFLIFTIAFLSRKSAPLTNENVLQEEYLAGKNISTTESLFSIIATEVSALTFIGIPAFAFNLDFRFIYLYFGAIIGRSILAIYFLPKIYRNETTIYEVITSDISGRRFITTIYMATKILSIGVRLYSGSILIAEYFNLNIYFAISALSLLTMIYTMIGGLKAVIRTDVIQTFIFILGGIAAHIYIPKIANKEWIDMIHQGWVNNKIITLSPNYLTIILTGFIGGIIFDMATHGVDQDFAQRLLAAKNIKSAQKSIFLSSFFSIFVGLLFLSIGTLLWSYHQSIPFNPELKSDYVFAVFITNKFPPFLKGLMMAGVLAATMSTLDSTINALSSCITTDIFPHRPSAKLRKYMKIDAFVITVILVFVSFIASQSNQILTLGLKIASWSGGFLLFTLTSSIFKLSKLNLRQYFFFYIQNLIVIYLSNIFLEIPWQWNTAISLISCLIVQKLFVQKQIR